MALHWPRLRRRRPRGRHALGAAVTSLPSTPLPAPAAPASAAPASDAPAPAAPAPAAPDSPATGAQGDVLASIAELPASGQAWSVPQADRSTPSGPPAQSGPRIQLGFRDGTTTALDPGSDQALALGELSQQLTERD